LGNRWLYPEGDGKQRPLRCRFPPRLTPSVMDFGKMLQDKEAMQRFGQTMVVWNLHTRQPKKVLHVPGAPLEVRFAWGARNNYDFTTTALTSKLWLIYEDNKGEWQAQAVADIGDPSKVPLPVDSTISADDRLLWVNTFMDGTTRAFDISDSFHPTPVYEKRIGSQVNMVSQSWDGKRFYFTSSLLANWDKKVVRFYNRGGHPHPLLDPMIRPLHLTDAEVAALVAFLESLTGDNIAALIADARSVRVGNVTVELPQ
jgi:56kDa selenium binding protein (SBP56)